MTDLHTLLQTCNTLLEPDKYKDYGPNGLQVEGDRPIRKIISGVTASRALIEAAIAADADAIFVHHGLFWRGTLSWATTRNWVVCWGCRPMHALVSRPWALWAQPIGAMLLHWRSMRSRCSGGP